MQPSSDSKQTFSDFSVFRKPICNEYTISFSKKTIKKGTFLRNGILSIFMRIKHKKQIN